MSEDNRGQDFQERLGENLQDGGGCTEAWEITNAIRDSTTSDCSGSGPSPTRRSFFRGTIASVVGAVGFTGLAAAADPTGPAGVTQARQKFESQEVAATTVREQSQDVLDELVNHGFIESANIDRYLPDTIGISGVLTDNTPTAHLHTELVNVDREVSINVEPQVGRQFAVVSSEDVQEVTVVDPGGNSKDIHPQCPAILACNGYGCTCPEYSVACCGSNCYFNGKTGNICSGCGYCGQPYNCGRYC